MFLTATVQAGPQDPPTFNFTTGSFVEGATVTLSDRKFDADSSTITILERHTQDDNQVGKVISHNNVGVGEAAGIVDALHNSSDIFDNVKGFANSGSQPGTPLTIQDLVTSTSGIKKLVVSDKKVEKVEAYSCGTVVKDATISQIANWYRVADPGALAAVNFVTGKDNVTLRAALRAGAHVQKTSTRAFASKGAKYGGSYDSFTITGRNDKGGTNHGTYPVSVCLRNSESNNYDPNTNCGIILINATWGAE